MTPQYMKPTDPDAFVDFPKKPRATWMPDDYVECPKCDGHGGWNLTLNAYNLWDRPDTPENRHRYSHFVASCSQCWGYGWVDPKETECIHTYKFLRSTGNCLRQEKCTGCDKVIEIDSSG
jgi:hypothetical protein